MTFLLWCNKVVSSGLCSVTVADERGKESKGNLIRNYNYKDISTLLLYLIDLSWLESIEKLLCKLWVSIVLLIIFRNYQALLLDTFQSSEPNKALNVRNSWNIVGKSSRNEKRFTWRTTKIVFKAFNYLARTLMNDCRKMIAEIGKCDSPSKCSKSFFDGFLFSDVSLPHRTIKKNSFSTSSIDARNEFNWIRYCWWISSHCADAVQSRTVRFLLSFSIWIFIAIKFQYFSRFPVLLELYFFSRFSLYGSFF